MRSVQLPYPGVLDIDQIVEDMKKLRRRRFKSSRAFSEETGFSREIARKIESGERLPDLAEFIEWVQACGADPAEVLFTHVSDQDKRSVKDAQRSLYRDFRSALNMPERKIILEALFRSWALDDERAGNSRR